MNYLFHQLQATKRLDIRLVVWDAYIADSLKQSTRDKRGKGVRRKVEKNTMMPIKWQDFLHDPENKRELSKFLTDAIASTQIPPHKVLVVTAGVGTMTKGTTIESIPD